ncbi:alpha/beta-hydrolase [Hypoxylon crocopeplum]|nr:alpha/beta-hydrolase [Hypoxylon crocopeplum]
MRVKRRASLYWKTSLNNLSYSISAIRQQQPGPDNFTGEYKVAKMSKPTIVLVPGSFALPVLYDNLVDAIVAKGYEIKALHYPCVGLKTEPREGELPTMYDDAACIAEQVANLANDGKDVMLVAHSYGGVPTTESTKGLTKKERQKEEKRGGVVRISYMTSIVPAVGSSAEDLLGEMPDENRVKYNLDEKGWLHFADIPAASRRIVSDLPDQKQREELVEGFQIHSSVSFFNKLTHAGYKDVPVSYLLCEDDEIILPKSQRDGIDIIEKASGNKVDITSIKAGHCPTVTALEKVVDWIIQAAAKHET